MTDVYVATILLAVTFLLICWVVTEFQIYRNSHSMEDELAKPGMSSRMSAWQVRVFQTLHDIRYFRQEKLKEENWAFPLSGFEKRNKTKPYRLAGKAK